LSGSEQLSTHITTISIQKILEKLIYKRLIVFIEDNGILSTKQFGFRTKHSTTQTIMSIVDKIQTVSLGSTESNVLPVTHGVPQGSVLGPLLFLLYINDFHNSSNVLEFHLFADDPNLFYKSKTLESLEKTINNQLKHVHTWLCANKLSLNIDKSNFVIFHPKQKKLSYQVKIYVNNIALTNVNSIKYLGVFLDANLSWKPHVEHVSSKIKRNIGIISKV